MDRREFFKVAGSIIAGVALGGFAPHKWLYKKASAHSNVHLVPVQVKNFERIGAAFVKLRFSGKLPEEIQVEVVNKKGTILGQGVRIKPTTPAFLHKVKQLNQNEAEVTLTMSPELITGSKNLLAVLHNGYGSNLTHVSIEVNAEPKILENPHPIEGYTDKISYWPGETIELKVHSPQPNFAVEFIRYGAEEKSLYKIVNIPGKKQKIPEYAYRNDLNWDTSLRFLIPSDWNTGLYAARLYDSTGKEFYCSFNIKKPIDSSVPKKRRIAVLSSTNTWTAYNTWGDASLYRYFIQEDIVPLYAQMVNYHRPNPEATPIGEPIHLANAEKLVLAWLEKNRYTFNVISDVDLHNNPKILKDYGTLIINTHGEYWTENMYNGLMNFLNDGGNLVTLSGNAIYWKVVTNGRQMEVRKLFGFHTLNGEKGGLWRNLKRPESSVLGVRYDPKGYMTFHPYEVKHADHWIFEGTGLKNGDLIGGKGLNRGGASGHETDKMDQFTPVNAVLLAKGTNPDEGGAEMVYYDHPGGGGVFSVGSVTFGGSLFVDDKLSKMVNNVLKRFTEKAV